MRVTLFVLLLPLCTWGAPYGTPAGHSIGAQLMLHHDARVATGYTEVVLNVNLPSLDMAPKTPSPQNCQEKHEVYAKLCEGLNSMDTTSFEIVMELKALFVKSDDLIIPRRSKRALLPFLGSFGKWIAGDALVEDLDKVIEKVNQLGHRAGEMAGRQVMFENITTQNLLQLHTMSETLDKKINSLAGQINSFQKEVAERSTEDEALIFRLVASSMVTTKINLLLTHLASLKSLYAACHSHTLSHLAVSRNQLLSVLANESTKLRQKDARFVIGPSIIESVYSFPTTRCIVNPNYSTLSISLSLPVAPLTSSWKVAELHPLKFLYQGLTCKVLQESTILAVRNDGSVLPLDSKPQGPGLLKLI